MAIFIALNLVYLLMSQSCCAGEVFTSIKSHCPFSTFCKTTPDQDFPENDLTRAPCCSQCSCSQSCWKFETCCPDVERILTMNAELAVCHTNFLNFTVNTVTSKEYYQQIKFVQYKMIVSCPANYTNLDIVRKCENSSSYFPQSLDDVVMVSDAREHDEIYKNRHCAACHGVTKVIRWDLTTARCDSQLFHVNRSMSEMLEFVLNNCIVLSVPSLTITLTPRSSCYPEAISRCNETGLMDSIDAEMEQECHEPYLPYFDTRGFRATVYRNVGCFLCNRPMDIPLPVVCQQSQINLARTIQYGMLALLDFDMLYQKEVNERNGDCIENEIYDSFMSICRPFRCPLFSSPFYGSCFPLYRHINHIRVQFYIRLTPIQSKVWLPDILSMNDETLFVSLINTYKRLISKLGLTKCDKCDMHADLHRNDNRNGGVFFMTFNMGTNDHCQFESIAQAISKFDQNVNITLRTTSWSIDVVPSTYFANHVFDGYFRLSKGYSQICSSELVEVTELSDCPHITMTLEEYHSYITKHEGVETFSNILRPGFYYISQDPKVVATCTTNMAINFSNKSSNYHPYVILKSLMIVLIYLL